MNYFIDIDGTLTTEGSKPWGDPIKSRIDRVMESAMNPGHQVVLWSANGEGYAFEWAKKHLELAALQMVTCLGKPDMIIDDSPAVRAFGPVGKGTCPEWLDS